MTDSSFIVAVKGISNVLKEMWKFCVKTWEIISNPKDTIISMIDGSYWILLITAMVCLILTMAGCKKTKNGATISIIIYVILQCLKVVLQTI